LFAGCSIATSGKDILCLGGKPTCSVWALVVLGLYGPFMLCSDLLWVKLLFGPGLATFFWDLGLLFFIPSFIFYSFFGVFNF